MPTQLKVNGYWAPSQDLLRQHLHQVVVMQWPMIGFLPSRISFVSFQVVLFALYVLFIFAVVVYLLSNSLLNFSFSTTMSHFTLPSFWISLVISHPHNAVKHLHSLRKQLWEWQRYCSRILLFTYQKSVQFECNAYNSVCLCIKHNKGFIVSVYFVYPHSFGSMNFQ